MATTTPSLHPAAGAVGAPGPGAAAPTASERTATRHAGLLLIALVAACAYAIFFHGAVDLPAETRLQTGLALVGMLGAAGWLTARTLRLAAAPTAWWGVGLLAGFALWCGLSLLWSVAPDRTWLEINRTLEYVLVVVLGIAVGATAARPLERVAVGFLVVVGVMALYSLGGKVLPGVSLPPFLDADQTAATQRLRAPLEYWNALALVCVFGIPLGIRVAVDASRRHATRLLALATVLLLAVVGGMTYSRGGIVALVTALVLMTVLGGSRLRGLAVVGLVGVTALPILKVAFTLPGLSENGAPLAQRIDDGYPLLAVIVVAGGFMLAAGWALLQIEPRVHWSDARSRLVWRGLAVAAAVAALGGILVLAVSDRGLTGSVDHAIESFTDTQQDRVYDPVRLISTNSGNRWVWWKEAAGAFSDRPAGGYGAGSFPVVHKRYRTAPLPVAQPHSVPLQFLAETGVFGALLALGGIGLLLFAAVSRLRAMAGGRERDLGVALFAGACAWVVHGVFDWDWDIPGVTVPVLLFLGVLCGTPGARRVLAPRRSVFGEPDPQDNGLRVAALVGCVLVLSLFLVSAILPAWSQNRTEAAQTTLTDEPTAAQLESAAAQAELAAKLDPIAVEPLFVAAAIAQGRDRLLDARRYLLEAADRQPDNPEVWYRLTGIALAVADRKGFQEAANKMLRLDPVNGSARAIASRAAGLLAPPEHSATATGTPLPAVQP